MSDILKYRIPQENIVSKTGTFVKLDAFDNYEGFLLTSFNKDAIYGFSEGKVEGCLYYSEKTPVCYSKSEYLRIGEQFLNDLKEEGLKKAIFSRIEEHSLEVDAEKLFFTLCETYPNAFVYFISSKLFGTWMGASPEVLIKDTTAKTEVVSLAGTKMANDSSNWEEKEVEEQRIVTDFIEKTLKSLNVSDLKKTGPEDKIAGPIKHLSSVFSFDKLNKEEELIDLLHPTPAVSGFPRDSALELIAKHEKHKRSLYAGIIGVKGEKSSLFVNLRCLQIQKENIYLYLGGGYTKDSKVESEWQETKNKGKTLLNVIEKI